MKNPIAKYLMCAYEYYELDKQLIEDFEFDALTKEILDNRDNIEHMHKYLLTKDMLVAGTYLGEYPNMVKGAVGNYMRENNL